MGKRRKAWGWILADLVLRVVAGAVVGRAAKILAEVLGRWI